MNILNKWRSIDKDKRFWIVSLIAIALLWLGPLLSRIPTPIPYPKEYPLKSGTFEEGANAYKAGKFGLALANFIAAGNTSDTRAMSMASRMYYKGKGVQRDICQGTYWADKAARNGDFISQMRLFEAYSDGYGVSMDFKKAYLWAKAAVDNPNVDKTNEWYKAMTGQINNPKDWFNSIIDDYSQHYFDEYNREYQYWDYRKEPEVKIIRNRHIPYIGAPLVTPCSEIRYQDRTQIP